MAATDLLTVAEARDAIKARSGDTSQSTLLESLYIPAVTDLVEDIVGPVVERAVTVTVNGGGRAIALDSLPVASVTSVTEGGTLLTGTDYVLDAGAGLLYRGSATATRKWATGLNGVVIVYRAGRAADTAAVPAAIKLAARIILANMWQNDRNGNRPDLSGAVDNGMSQTPSGALIPTRAYNYLEPYSLASIPTVGGV